jgi:hypothetical protein
LKGGYRVLNLELDTKESFDFSEFWEPGMEMNRSLADIEV